MSRAAVPQRAGTNTRARLSFELRNCLTGKGAMPTTKLLELVSITIYPASTDLATVEDVLREDLCCEFTVTSTGYIASLGEEKSEWRKHQERLKQTKDKSNKNRPLDDGFMDEF